MKKLYNIVNYMYSSKSLRQESSETYNEFTRIGVRSW